MNWPTGVATKKGLLGATTAVLAVFAGAYVITGANPLSGAFAAAKPPVTTTPTISSTGPANPTNATTASFTFTGESGSTFKCKLDAAAAATCTSPKAFASLTQGSHTFSVTATASGKTESSAATRTWVVDTTPPPAPVISGMDASTASTTAQFKLSDSESGVDFRCSLDSAGYGTCDKNPKYTGLATGAHCFEAKAVDAASNSSAASKFCWTVTEDKQDFVVSGSAVQPFYPGISQRIDLVLTNPNGSSIHVDSVTVNIANATKHADGSPNLDCVGQDNLTVTHQYSGNVTLPGKSTMSLTQLGVATSDWPELTMPDLSTNQDACKDTRFSITYSGTASK